MAPMKNNNNNLSSNYGEAVSQQANVLASCYIVDPSASLKGLHYCTTVPISGLPSPPTSPPLAALTSTNELALKPKKRSSNNATSRGRRGGATLQIREECERFFCETMKTVFQVEGNMASNGSGLAGVYIPMTPPDDYPTPPSSFKSDSQLKSAVDVIGWMEFWDYVGGASFRAFITEDGDDKTLFAFFDIGLVGRDLKQALIALIEVADVPLGCSQTVICLDRQMPQDDTKALMKSLQWVGFELVTLDHWAKELDVTSDRWLFMGMDI
ncbi:ornithine decarboxylase antizyme [Pseudomassariella vexata]|uniref:Ornithine decarboxylase antizyme n=1 Tax=Pseudomassariella vexata TaxID=1141098 RepID=A0A1Y2E076_9PEZI|nr:ornithine decarboxylase antizyme [Pseudomassariella vexata]ORY64932.1 ornithine decarboxylase antizyme [Pseudomassariella vexata]